MNSCSDLSLSKLVSPRIVLVKLALYSQEFFGWERGIGFNSISMRVSLIFRRISFEFLLGELSLMRKKRRDIDREKDSGF